MMGDNDALSESKIGFDGETLSNTWLLPNLSAPGCQRIHMTKSYTYKGVMSRKGSLVLLDHAPLPESSRAQAWMHLGATAAAVSVYWSAQPEDASCQGSAAAGKSGHHER